MKKFIIMMVSCALIVSATFFVAGCNPEDPGPQPIYYSEYGAKGDGVTDDFDAIAATHNAANELNRPVKADKDAVYYIGATTKSATIKTDTDWGNAKFMIDDAAAITLDDKGQNIAGSWIFDVVPTANYYDFTKEQRDEIGAIEKGQTQLPLTLVQDSMIQLKNSDMIYIRKGQNQNTGAERQEMILVKKDGTVDPDNPILWDYSNLNRLRVFPLDQTTITVKGGFFTTIANLTGENTAKNTNPRYISRGIRVTRSNTVLDNIYHDITGEPEIYHKSDPALNTSPHSAPYTGFINITDCANVTLQNSTLTGHRGYYRPSRPADDNTRRGSYDFQAVRAVNITVQNCKQTNDITNSDFWGLCASNYVKNVFLDEVEFSRFDAHQGVHNTTITNSTFGWQCVSVIGSGLLYLENLTVKGADNYIYFREDYGSTWEGEVVIKNATYIPKATDSYGYDVFFFKNDGSWDFGYPTFMPKKITVEGMYIDDSAVTTVPNLFHNRTNKSTDNNFPTYAGTAQYAMAVTEELRLDNFTVKSGKQCFIPSNLKNNMAVYWNGVLA